MGYLSPPEGERSRAQLGRAGGGGGRRRRRRPAGAWWDVCCDDAPRAGARGRAQPGPADRAGAEPGPADRAGAAVLPAGGRRRDAGGAGEQAGPPDVGEQGAVVRAEDAQPLPGAAGAVLVLAAGSDCGASAQELMNINQWHPSH